MNQIIILKERILWEEKTGQDHLDLVLEIRKKKKNVKDQSLAIVRNAVVEVSSAVKRYFDFYCELEI